jgi:MinD-like ATPase involved in chromosome partitioning or flagellar assembly
MTSTFSEVLNDVVAAVVTCPDSKYFAEFVVVRDLRGIARLAVIGPFSGSAGGMKAAITSIENALLAKLGQWFQGPVLCDEHKDQLLAEVAKRLKAEASDWNPLDPLGQPVSGKWLRLERRLTKDAWASTTHVAPPWPLKGTQPPIVAFYSFKGGVGRSTALAGVAYDLGKANKRVAIVDLDLEAPGMGPFFGVSPNRGVIDVLVDFSVMNQIDLNQASARPPFAFGGAENMITIFPAGARLDAEYLEKLGRLDFGRAALGSNGSPVAVALGELLKTLRQDYDFILVDARAGLHDLGGLALQGLAHVDVIVARPSQQTTAGLRLALGHLRVVRGDQMQVAVVHGHAPTDSLAQEAVDFRQTVHDIFSEVVYPADDLPDLMDDSQMHHVTQVPQDPRLAYLRDATDALPVFESGIYAPLTKRLLERIALVREP